MVFPRRAKLRRNRVVARVDPTLKPYGSIGNLQCNGRPDRVRQFRARHRPCSIPFQSCVNIKVSIIKDDTGLRNSLAVLISGSPGFRLVSVHADAEHALQHMPVATPNVVLVGINLPRMSGIECVRRLKTICPQLQLMMLTVYDECQKILESLKAGASGYLLMRSTPPAKILEAIKEVYHGGAPMSAEVARLVVSTFHENKPAHPSAEKLTPREEQVLRQIAQGARSKEVAEALKIAVPTVQTHLQHIYEKLQARSRSEAVAKYLIGS